MNKNFYDLSSRLVSSTFLASPVGLKPRGDSGDLPNDVKLLLGDYENFSFPLVFKQEDGKKLQDILDTGYVSLFLISDNMKRAFQENNLTGWQTFDVKIFDKRGNEIEGYHGFSVTGRCGSIYCKKSEIIEKKYVTDGPIVQLCKGVHFDPETWNGSDFFVPLDWYGIIITERVAEILKKDKFTNVYLQNLSEMELDLFYAFEFCRDE